MVGINGELLTAALHYASKDMDVFPCVQATKAPYTTNGHLNATKEPDLIYAWWKKWPTASIGYAPTSGIAVWDVDIKHREGKYGDESQAQFEAQYGKFPDTVMSLTGGGGIQYFFKTDRPLSCKNGILPAIDLKSKGGYVILPPSIHPTGNRYEWEVSSDIDEVPMAMLPEAVYQLAKTVETTSFETPETIPTGQRNEIIFKLACSLRSKGLTDIEALAALQQVNKDRCLPPIDGRELAAIVKSAAKYKPGSLPQGNDSVKPADFTDAGNAKVFTTQYDNRAIFVRAMGWLTWNGQKWEANDLKALALATKLSEEILFEAQEHFRQASAAKAEAILSQDKAKIESAEKAEKVAKSFLSHALQSRNKPKLSAMLEVAKPALHKELEELDADPFTLNTPAGMVDLRTGSIQKHDPTALCSNITKCAPGVVGAEMWQSLIELITQGDGALAGYLQLLAGMAAIGAVYMENITIAYGGGRNGKSTFFNALAAVMGDYSGSIVPEVLTTDKQNRGADLAELKGKRLILAAELEEGRRLSTGILKRLASTDKVAAERKYRDPESFTPTHTLILFTNHLPKLGTLDGGTKRRITTVPFGAVIPEAGEIKNYGQKLVDEAGGAILSWIIEGAVRFCQSSFTLHIPETVAIATEEYFNANDWMGAFLEECCKIHPSAKAGGKEIYSTYRIWSENRGDFIRSNADFTSELENRGFSRRKSNTGAQWYGLSITAAARVYPLPCIGTG